MSGERDRAFTSSGQGGFLKAWQVAVFPEPRCSAQAAEKGTG